MELALSIMGRIVGQAHVNINEPDWSLRIVVRKDSDKDCVCGSIGPFGIVQPGSRKPLLSTYVFDPNSARNQIAACVHRMGRLMPPIDPTEFDKVKKYFVTLLGEVWPSPSTRVKLSFAEWIETRGYTGGRKKYLSKLYEDVKYSWITKKNLYVESFIKEEGYEEEGKMPRGINSYSDFTKVILGPLFHTIDKDTFAAPYFVKGSNPLKWRDMLEERFGDMEVLSTDFSSFEAHHRAEYSELIYMWYKHMTRRMDNMHEFDQLVSSMMLGRNRITFSSISVEVDQRLMSGALWTSSANSVLNFVLTSYMWMKTKFPNQSPEENARNVRSEFVGLFEGDDGICPNVGISQVLVDDLGLVLKPTPSPTYNAAGFCGICCDRDTGIVIRDPIAFLRKFFCLPRKASRYKRARKLALYKAKALSYSYLFSGCPVVGAVCEYVIRNTRNIDHRPALQDFDAYDREHLVFEAGTNTVQNSSRVLVEHTYGVSVAEQLRIESHFERASMFCTELDLSMYALESDKRNVDTYLQEDPTLWKRPDILHDSVIDRYLEHGLEGPSNLRSHVDDYDGRAQTVPR